MLIYCTRLYSAATADEFHDVLAACEFASAIVKCDSCLIYVLEARN